MKEPVKIGIWEPLPEGVKLTVSYRRNKAPDPWHTIMCLQTAKCYALISGHQDQADNFQAEIDSLLMEAYLKFMEKHLKKYDDLTLPACQSPS